MAAPLRGFLIDSARCLESRAYYRRLIVFCAERGLNTLLWHFTDDQGCTLQFDCAPEIAGPHAYPKSEMRALVRFARRHGITLIPELESLGHSRYLTRHPRFRHLIESEEEFTAICPLAEETRSIMRSLLREIAEVFDSPLIHVGLDEVKLGGHPLTRQALRRTTEREILAGYALFLHREISALGRRMIIWGDRRTRALDILPLLPRDIVIADWEYSRHVPPDQAAHFLSLGFDVLLCPALITYDQPFLSGTQLGLSNVRSMSALQALQSPPGKILGLVTTVWTPTRYLHDAQWLALFLAAEIMRDPTAKLRTGLRHFLLHFHALKNPPRDLLNALEAILELAPLRDPYLRLLRHDRTRELPQATLLRNLEHWSHIASVLRSHRPTIRQYRRAWDTLRLAVDVLAFLHCRTLSANPFPHQPTGRILLKRLRSAWDRERFPDDPRKNESAFVFDRAEHLLLSFADGLKNSAP